MDYKRLKKYLDKLYETFDIKYLSPDPLEIVHKFQNPLDKEIIGLLASILAYGNVKTIIKSVSSIIEIIGSSPINFILNFNPQKDIHKFSFFKHRFTSGMDVANICFILKNIYREYGSLKEFYYVGYNESDEDIQNSLISFVDRFLSYPVIFDNKDKNVAVRFNAHNKLCRINPTATKISKAKDFPALRYLFPSPQKGSACKRLNLFLRWMVRRGDKLDFGLWDKINPNKLIIPVDTHIAKICRNIGLTTRNTADWKMAKEITENLKKLDPVDPVKYDFAITRLGIVEKCPGKKMQNKCAQCLIKNICIIV